MFSKLCPDCASCVQVRSIPAGNSLLAHYECINAECETGPIYTINVAAATERADAEPSMRAMRDLSACLEKDAADILGLFDFLRALGRED